MKAMLKAARWFKTTAAGIVEEFLILFHRETSLAFHQMTPRPRSKSGKVSATRIPVEFSLVDDCVLWAPGRHYLIGRVVDGDVYTAVRQHDLGAKAYKIQRC